MLYYSTITEQFNSTNAFKQKIQNNTIKLRHFNWEVTPTLQWLLRGQHPVNL